MPRGQKRLGGHKTGPEMERLTLAIECRIMTTLDLTTHHLSRPKIQFRAGVISSDSRAPAAERC